MSKSVEKCLLFYKVLKKDKSFGWNEKCEKAFTKFKEYFSYLLILTRSNVRETLFLYIVAFDEAMGTVLIIERKGEQRPIYYTSKVPHGTKLRY